MRFQGLTMKKLITPETGRVRVIETDSPRVGEGDLLLRMQLCGICGTDVMKVYDANVAKPVALGHEIVGVVEVGAGSFRKGIRVAAAHHAPDAHSHFSKRGSETMDALFKSSNVDPCGFAEFIRVPTSLVSHTVHVIPDSMTNERAAFMEPLACCIRATDRAGVTAGDTVVVVGVGAIGMLFVPLVQSLGAQCVAIDQREERLQLAAGWGARRFETLGTLTEGRGADAVILTVVNHATLKLALDAVRDGGRIITFGVKPGTNLGLDMWQVYRRELAVMSSYSATPSGLARAMALLARDEFDFERLISHRFNLDNAQQGFELLKNAQASKVLIEPN
jgi:L-iditol 2-dehydrogenase